jgi:hypothetical protein
MAGTDWLLRHRKTFYPVLNVGVSFAVAIGGAVNGASFGLVLYVCLLFALCSTPLLLLQRLNDRYVLLGIFMALYFLFFGALDFSTLLFGTDVFAPRKGFLSSAEVAILLGAALAVAGYRAGARFGLPTGPVRPAEEWPASTVLFMGSCLWVLGTVAMIYFQLVVVTEKTNAATARGLASMGPLLTFAVMLGHLLQPLGLLMLAYGYAKNRGVFWLTLILIVVSAQVAMGFVADIKILAMMGGALVIMARTLVDNRLPKAWIAAAVAFVIVAFPIFQAYRTEVTGERGLDKAQAVRELGKVIEIVLASRDKAASGRPGERAQTFVERSSGKASLELLFDHVGVDVPFLYGRSLVAIPLAFVPRLLAPDKEDLSVGQLFTKQILKSSDDTYISASHLGEMYWNFGWPGILAGLSLAGFLLGFVGGKFNLEQGISLTRVLILLATVQTLCMGFGGTMPGAYVNWLRSMAAIGLMHLLFVRRDATAAPVAAPAVVDVRLPPAPTRGSGAMLPVSVAVPRFPNLLS